MIAGLERFAETEHGDVTRLGDVDPPTWRLRVGGHRVLFEFDYVIREMRIQHVARRDQAYRG